ncbi:Riboflavin synthase-like beta-barrel [Penicillium canariense]|uniref:ferric-chelate reductase (NADPH) n=1 Tax=Penicillium canariense TaxID=189055 RepID=A0A9W9LTP6_9EURO|nr:Riboflavin synthase-like beta-barrel [Penicillium canariense]KAJ5175339.1 Riboflavin synthase-like beta-barrel [Penicillium canariense]
MMNMNMDMDMTGGIPWLDQPVMLHSSRKDKCKLTDAQCSYRNYSWRYWYQADHVYALNTVYFCCAVIAVFVISHLLVQVCPDWVKRTRVWRATTSVSRYMSYRGYRFSVLKYWSPSLGVITLGIVGAIFFFGMQGLDEDILGSAKLMVALVAMTLGPKPYYWPTDASYGSSPPIATRAGWMALALLPFILALSVKANMISALTGIPHEKLQVFHHWTSYAMFVLALIHTFPFIIYHIDKGDMVKQWKTSLVYWTGIGAIIPQAYLTIMSLPFIRNRFYEFFKATHMMAAVLFIVFFFLHCDFRLSSWDYFIASGVIYFLCLLFSQVRTYLLHGIHTASLELLPCGLVRVSVPTVIKWAPGQHVFVRFLTSDLHLLTAHPFTISSVCHDPDQIGKASELIFYIKPRRGVTARLAALAAKQPGITKKILIDGPYGGVSTHHMSRFDTLLVIAGGSGGGFSLAMVDEALRQSGVTTGEDESGQESRRHLQVVFSTRNTSIADWYIHEIESRLSQSTTLPGSDIGFETSVSVHITSNRDSTLSTSTLDSEKGSTNKLPPTDITTTGSFSLNVHRNARPDLPGLLARTVATAHANPMPNGKKQRIGVLVCGPASMLHDTRNAAALAQKRTFGGEVEELYLHSEPFA